VFAREPDVVGLTGRVLLDGATGEAVDREDAEAVIAADSGSRTGGTHRWQQLYGCNFAYRRAAAPAELFDARLPLYSWLEDHDFARRLLRHGRIVKADDCVIVHRGVKSGGRAEHARLGYSQMMNPLYLHRKGSFPLWLTVKEIVPRCGKNLVLSLGGPEASWRRQRLRGNLAALRDAVTGSFEPERMLRH
jgi:GT2 family glycosyltransferase